MAINPNDYKKTKFKNLKVNKNNKREYLFDFRENGVRYRKVETLAERTGWKQKEHDDYAYELLNEYRRNIKTNTGNLQITSNTKLNELWEL